MFNSTILDVLIGLAFIYLLLALICTTINEWWAGIFKTRGKMLVQGISQRDYSLIMGTTLLYAFVIAVLNLIVDVLYGVIDPPLTYR